MWFKNNGQFFRTCNGYTLIEIFFLKPRNPWHRIGILQVNRFNGV